MKNSSITVKKPFASIVETHGPTVLRVCRAVVGFVDADDAWSETFLSALKAYPELPADANVEAWLVTIAHRRAIDVTRAISRRGTPVAVIANVASNNGADGLDLDLVDAVAGLPLKQRQAVAYHYLVGLPYSEIAEIVGGSIDAARRAAADGIASIRRQSQSITGRKGRAK